MIRSIHDNETDVVFGSYEENEPELTFFPIIRENLILIAPPQMEIAEDVIHSIHDFQKTPFISYDHSSNMGKFTRKIFREEHLMMNFVCESSDELAILALVTNNFGISYVAETKEVRAAIQDGRVKQIYIEENGELVLFPRSGPQRIIFGDSGNLEEKFEKLYTFYAQIVPVAGWNKYSEVNLKFRGEIICKRMKKKKSDI